MCPPLQSTALIEEQPSRVTAGSRHEIIKQGCQGPFQKHKKFYRAVERIDKKKGGGELLTLDMHSLRLKYIICVVSVLLGKPFGGNCCFCVGLKAILQYEQVDIVAFWPPLQAVSQRTYFLLFFLAKGSYHVTLLYNRERIAQHISSGCANSF